MLEGEEMQIGKRIFHFDMSVSLVIGLETEPGTTEQKLQQKGLDCCIYMRSRKNSDF